MFDATQDYLELVPSGETRVIINIHYTICIPEKDFEHRFIAVVYKWGTTPKARHKRDKDGALMNDDLSSSIQGIALNPQVYVPLYAIVLSFSSTSPSSPSSFFVKGL